jgi:tight adherence protein B
VFRKEEWAPERTSGLVATVVLLLLCALPVASWGAGAGSIDHVEPEGSRIGILYSIPELPAGVAPELSSTVVTIEGSGVDSSAELAADASAQETVRRTAVLAIDVSLSMRGERFAQAKIASETFLSALSPDVYVGIVAFAGDVVTVQEPSLDRAESIRSLDSLSLSLQTRLYDGIRHAVGVAGDEGQRSVLVLSDGKDTSGTPLEDIESTVANADVQVDVVALDQRGKALDALTTMATAGDGSVFSADDPSALSNVFSDQALRLARQILIMAEIPSDAPPEGTLEVSVKAGAATYTDSAFVGLGGEKPVQAPAPGKSEPQPAAGFAVSKNLMLVGLATAGVAVLILLLGALGLLGGSRPMTVEDRIAAYSRASTATHGHSSQSVSPPGSTQSLAGSAVGMAEKALASNEGVAASIGARLDAAGLALKPSEWVLMHGGIAFGTGLLGLLVTGGNPVAMLVALTLGGVLPWMYLGLKRGRRLKAFNAQLPDTLQLIAGGLSAGLSLAQSLDTVVRQGSEPMTTEFRRALVEARLGVSLEETLDAIGQRMQSRDFEWVVIAIRIQREVGGNLAEVINQVASTIREREYLRRQVKSLSAEGVLSAWILGALPPVMFAYFMLVRPDYMSPMFTDPLGWTLLGISGVMMTVGVLWMRKLVRMEV